MAGVDGLCLAWLLACGGVLLSDRISCAVGAQQQDRGSYDTSGQYVHFIRLDQNGGEQFVVERRSLKCVGFGGVKVVAECRL